MFEIKGVSQLRILVKDSGNAIIAGGDQVVNIFFISML